MYYIRTEIIQKEMYSGSPTGILQLLFLGKRYTIIQVQSGKQAARNWKQRCWSMNWAISLDWSILAHRCKQIIKMQPTEIIVIIPTALCIMLLKPRISLDSFSPVIFHLLM